MGFRTISRDLGLVPFKPSSNGRNVIFQRLGAYAIERVEQLADVAEIQ
jgi:hypothetical protein